MSEKSTRLIAQMVVNTMAGDRKRVRRLHEEYVWENRLRVSIREYMEWRQKTA